MNQQEIEKYLNRQVTPRMVDIWNGVGIRPEIAERLRQTWERQASVGEPLPITESRKPAPTLQRIGLAHHGCPGDWLCLTAACQSIWQQFPTYCFRLTGSCCPEIFANAPWHFDGRPDLEITVDYGPWINRSNQDGSARFLASFFYDLRDKLGLSCPLTTNKPHIFLSPQEQILPRQVEGPYAVICSGFKKDYPVKAWAFERWQAVVDWIRKEKGIQVVQVGEVHPNHFHKPLDGCLNLIGQTGTRELYLLAYHSLFGLGHESYLHHVYASHFHARPDKEALPFVCVASGWNPKGWASYNTEAYLTKGYQLDCCKGGGGCWKPNLRTCKYPVGDVARCMNMVSVEEAIAAIDGYYGGGLIDILNAETRSLLAKCNATHKRTESFTAFLERLAGTRKPLIVETGCIRSEDDFGAGYSTFIFGTFLKHQGGKLVSVDNDPINVSFARSKTPGLPVQVVWQSSLDFFKAYQGDRITALYLDSLDAYLPGHQEHCLEEAKLALPHLADDALILIDDTPAEDQGKGCLAIPWLLSQGFKVVYRGWQVLLERKANNG